MLLVYRKADGRIMNGPNTNSAFPDGPPLEVELNEIIRLYGGAPADYGEFRINDFEQAALVQEIFRAATFELTFDADGTPSGVVTYSRLEARAAPESVGVDGVVNVTATLPPGAADTHVAFQVEGGSEVLEPVIGLQATKAYAFASPGRYIITCRSTTKHGARSVEVIVQ